MTSSWIYNIVLVAMLGAWLSVVSATQVIINDTDKWDGVVKYRLDGSGNSDDQTWTQTGPPSGGNNKTETNWWFFGNFEPLITDDGLNTVECKITFDDSTPNLVESIEFYTYNQLKLVEPTSITTVAIGVPTVKKEWTNSTGVDRDWDVSISGSVTQGWSESSSQTNTVGYETTVSNNFQKSVTGSGSLEVLSLTVGAEHSFGISSTMKGEIETTTGKSLNASSTDEISWGDSAIPVPDGHRLQIVEQMKTNQVEGWLHAYPDVNEDGLADNDEETVKRSFTQRHSPFLAHDIRVVPPGQ